MSTILVTGAAGYLGTHTLLELFQAGHQVVAVDNYCNSKPEALRRVRALSGRDPVFYQIDVGDRAALDTVFRQHAIDAVIHFAALKSVSESVAQPLRYYQNNLSGTLTLLAAMQQAGVRRMVFSSSATVYRDANGAPFTEDSPLGPINPYGSSKLMMENIMRDLAASEAGWHIALLRYFNPVGAHESGMIGEDPCGIPNNLMPFISQVASGKLQELRVFGGDYPTPDGTGVRDYIHVVDLAQAHVKALGLLQGPPETITLNLGSGQGYSVLQMIQTFAAVSGRPIPYRISARRDGDIPSYYADPGEARRRLGWTTQRTLEDICRDSWRWQQNNPQGYPDEPA
jgi:UDP-glucose 4-epimerase